jgi:osmotically-inducible protein OsmY
MHQRYSRGLAVGVAVVGALFLSVVTAGAQAPADNTGTNKRDRQPGAVTADQQKENTNDRTLTQKIRQSLMADKDLSTYAHNVKIVAQHGQVTLKGPVRSADEKKSVEDKATAVAGAGRVVNHLSIAPVSQK